MPRQGNCSCTDDSSAPARPLLARAGAAIGAKDKAGWRQGKGEGEGEGKGGAEATRPGTGTRTGRGIRGTTLADLGDYLPGSFNYSVAR